VSKRKRIRKIATSDTAIDTTLATFGAALALVLPFPLGPIVAAGAATTMADILKTASHRQHARMTNMVTTAAAGIRDQVAAGAVTTRSEAEAERLVEVVEGSLLAARDAFEQRKLPLIANLLATAPFTGTPIANLVSTLSLIERLTYRQLCLLALIPGYLPSDSDVVEDSRRLFATREGTRSAHGEWLEGIAAELTSLEQQGVIVAGAIPTTGEDMAAGAKVSGSFALTYAGRILANGTHLRRTIPAVDLEEIRAQLDAGGPQIKPEDPATAHIDQAP
jgi:hypothetical protein